LNSWDISNGAQPIIDLGVNIFAIGLQLAAPVILTIFLIDFAFGMISRVAPQVNVFMLGFQLKPPVGTLILLLTLPLLTERIVWLINMMTEEYTRVLMYLR
jgi:flagellar biosynthesis protein FliR